MQRPNPDSIYYQDFSYFQRKLCHKLKTLRAERAFTQEDMTDFELSLRQYQRMEQDPTAISSLWQVYKLAKAFDMEIHELLDIVDNA